MMAINKNQKALIEIITMALFFAPSFLLNKIAVSEIEPITLVALRVGIAGLLLLFILKLRNIAIPRNPTLWKHCFILGFFANGLPFVLFSYSIIYVPTSLAALINGMTPVLTVFLANIFLHDESLNLNRILAVLMGIGGFLVLFLPKILQTTDATSFDTLGIFFCFIGAALYAVAAVYARKFLSQNIPPLVAPTLQLLSSLIYLVPVAFLLETPKDVLTASLTSWAALLGVAVSGTMLAFIMYHRIVTLYGATVLSMSTFLLPIFATILGVIFLNEMITVNFAIAALLILSGVGIINGLIPIPFLSKTRVLTETD